MNFQNNLTTEVKEQFWARWLNQLYFLIHNEQVDAKMNVFQKELYNVESLYKYIQRTYTVFSTVIMSKTHRVLPRIVTVQWDFRW
jgi:dihydroorotase